MTHPTSRTALQQDFHQNFQNFHVFKRALFINYALIPRVVAWLGPLLYITGLVVLAPLAFGAGISIGTLFKLLVPQLSVLLTIPFTFEPTSILYWCVTIWELAVIYELIEKLVRETKIRTLFAQFQKNNRLLQTGYAYKINNHHSLIITQLSATDNLTHAIAKLPNSKQNQWEKITHITEGHYGFRRATNYDISAIQKFLQMNFSHQFEYLAVLPSLESLPFYWPLQESPSKQAVFYFKDAHNQPIYVLKNFTKNGARVHKTFKQFLGTCFNIFIY